MASFLEELWNSIFTPGPTPTLLVATNAVFAALQLLLAVLLIATYSLHFLVLSALCGGLWYSINWFATEIAKEQQAQKDHDKKKGKSPEPDASDTETEGPLTDAPVEPATTESTSSGREQEQSQKLVYRHEKLQEKSGSRPEPKLTDSSEALRRRRSLGDSSGYVSTDSEWEKVSEGEEKSK
jgi:hypothetical protein